MVKLSTKALHRLRKLLQMEGRSMRWFRRFLRRAEREADVRLRDAPVVPQTDPILEQIKRDHARNVPDTVDEDGEYVQRKNHKLSPELRAALQQRGDLILYGRNEDQP